ncbi:ABC transporter ATP-binding protein [Staphylococcus gallinarum]|uniref:ABC transporter ATP-binding protein n=1 Tax=Staphylococcus gallinarum TaxID=1293 RepID=A0A380FIG0_STAGA|nr:ABC transporter ATP-binding protein [Staphylococcus gallinarum]
MSVIKSFAIEDNEEKNFDRHNRHFLDRAFKHTRWNAYSFSAINTVTDIGPIIVIGVGALFCDYRKYYSWYFGCICELLRTTIWTAPSISFFIYNINSKFRVYGSCISINGMKDTI